VTETLQAGPTERKSKGVSQRKISEIWNGVNSNRFGAIVECVEKKSGRTNGQVKL